jgi:hypothetical protein
MGDRVETGSDGAIADIAIDFSRKVRQMRQPIQRKVTKTGLQAACVFVDAGKF